jgi:hypothetical protein
VAPSPIIPTSFVPKQPVRGSGQYKHAGGNIFFVGALILFGFALLSSVGVFAYERYLEGVRDSKQTQVDRAQEAIDAVAVEDFIRTRNRFSAAEGLLEGHVAASQFFALLEGLTLQNVRFDTLSFRLAEDRSAEIQMSGTARTFNALAAQSSLFASENRVKRAIFSDINVNPAGTVSFTLTADLSSSLLTFSKDVASVRAETLPSDLPLEEEPEEVPTPLP